MPYEDAQLGRAFDAVTCLQVARHFGLDLRVGLQKSPFRQDQHGASFSLVPPDGRFFKDHADDEVGGGVWKFTRLCAERAGVVMSGKEIRNLLVELNGEVPEKLTRGQVKRQVAEKRKDLYFRAEVAARDIPRLEVEEPSVWSDSIRQRWEAGVPFAVESADKLADSRGWDEDMLVGLIDAGKTSCPVLPWDRGRGWAWVVEKPVFDRGQLRLVPVGFHARYKIAVKSGGGGQRRSEKRWVYVPYIPSFAKTDFQRQLLKMQAKLPAYPFVLAGDTYVSPKLLVILEGQFDAVSFAAAFGWLDLEHGQFPPGVYVMGLRGVQSQKALLAAYGVWLRKHQPFVWIIGDNDAAGRKIDAVKGANAIAAEPTFVDRLRAQGCTVHAELISHPGCKDFNDVYRAAKPSLETMVKWADHVGAVEIERPSAEEVADFMRARWPHLSDRADEIAEANCGDVRASLNDLQTYSDRKEFAE